MWFGGQKIDFGHKMLWFESNFGTKNERKNAVFCPLKIGENIDDIVDIFIKFWGVNELDFLYAVGLFELKIFAKMSLWLKIQEYAMKIQQRVNEMDTCLKKVSCEVRDFDSDLVRRLLQSIKVINEDTLEIQFKTGIVMKQRVSYYE
jgi:hypothetical protein